MDNIRKYLQVIRRSCDLLEKELDALRPGTAPPLPEPVELLPQSVNLPSVRQEHVQKLLAIPDWPAAVAADTVASDDSYEQQYDRGQAILDVMLDESLENKHFLDFGCGSGFAAFCAHKSRKVLSATGYDICQSGWWANLQGPTYTTERQGLKSAHYDVIFMYDVLDHVVNIPDLRRLMDDVRQLLRPGGSVYVCCHPWTSRHATHTYKTGLNKAFIHLFLSQEECLELGFTPLPTRRETDPLKAYADWFGGFKTVSCRQDSTPVEGFFLADGMKQLLIAEQKLPKDRHGKFFEEMAIDFIHYRLC